VVVVGVAVGAGSAGSVPRLLCSVVEMLVAHAVNAA
jgi:hypothetical protein